MHTIPKTTILRCEEHLEFVRNYTGRKAEKVRRYDPHHIPSLLGTRRRSCDLFVIPLTREQHGNMHTVAGIVWERENLLGLYQQVFRLLEEDEFVNTRIGEEVCLSGQSADTIEKMARLCSLAILRYTKYV